jgi:hypothetical protein
VNPYAQSQIQPTPIRLPQFPASEATVIDITTPYFQSGTLAALPAAAQPASAGLSLLSRPALHPPRALRADKGMRKKLTCEKHSQTKYIQQDAHKTT